ncbi:MAG: ABC transporter permease [Anaerolineaceae bacterium]|nr:ABC transporter permease [Anaerolineaceae bacterium]
MNNKFSKIIKNNMPWIILIVISIIFSFFSHNFFKIQNIINILNQNAFVIVCAIGITFIMMSGQIDLSVGYQMSLIGVTIGLLNKNYAIGTVPMILLAIVMGVLLNELNMVLSIKLNIGLLMVTTATSMLYQGISYTISGSKAVGGFPDSFKKIGQSNIPGTNIPIAILIMLVFAVIMELFLTKTYWGRHIYAMGGNEDASRLAGIEVTKTKYMIGAIAGVFVGLSTVMLISRLGSVNSSSGPGTEFTVLIGILLGGVSVRGGEGRLSGVVAGILIMAILSNGMQLAGFGIYLQYVVKGIIMLAAIGIDVYQLNHQKIIDEKLS